jgi:membrane protease YdiL (CAAX protease family)
MVGLSAGIGEEITMRGALQPKLGIGLTALLFALLHVQYSWFGMLVILLFGVALGLLRRATSTTVVMAVHTLYDVLALMTG